ncbi:hypothetical protein FQN49_004089 [Arthroderma sp. PD_2]|nr:hypothetical protein FQN49_004089 [Arthroderma sp. PD_2]
MARLRKITPSGESQPPKSRSASAKRQQGATSSRLTRSRSRELGESPAHLSYKVPSVPQKSDNAAERTHVLRTPRSSDASSRGNGLSPIAERRVNEASHGLEFSPGHQSHLSQTYVAESQADHGNISGTTMLQTDDSEHESEGLDAHLILDTLPDLLSASNKALDLLSPPGISYASISKHFQTSKFGARFNRIKETFEAQKKCMGKANFIPVERSVEALSSIKRLDWKSRGLYQKANLAQLALDLVKPQPTTSTAVADDNFPIAFMDSFTHGLAWPSREDDLKRETVQLGLELRTQRFIATLRSDSASEGSEPEELLEDVFYNPSLGDLDAGLRGWAMNGLEDDDNQVPREFHGIVRERVDLIRRSLGKKGGLEAEFPWSDFVIDIANWIRKRANDIDQQLRSQMSIEDAVKILQAELDKHSSFGPGHTLDTISSPVLDDVEPPAERNTTPEKVVETSKEGDEGREAAASPIPRPRRRFLGKGALRRVLAIEPGKEAPPKPAPPPAVEEGPPPPSQHEELPAELFDYDNNTLLNVEESSPPPQQDPLPETEPANITQESSQKGRTRDKPEERTISNAEILNLAAEGNMAVLNKRKGPRGAFIDRQNDARRISPISYSPSPRSDIRAPSSPQKRTAAKAFDHNDDESEEDSEFETDNRPPKQRRVLPPRPVIASSSRTSSIQAPPRPAQPPPRPAASSSSRMDSTTNTRLTGRTTNAIPASTAPQRFEQIAVETQPTLNWSPRRAWSLAEETCLRELIEECGGPAWSEIKRRDAMAGDILFRRTQVQIKDKGGQMHYDDLMTGRALSDAMANVPIKAKMRERLIREGKIAV